MKPKRNIIVKMASTSRDDKAFRKRVRKAVINAFRNPADKTSSNGQFSKIIVTRESIKKRKSTK